MGNFKQKLVDFKRWAFKSWTIWFNTLVALFAIFSETFQMLQSAVDPKVYAAIFILVPMVNFFLRLRTEKKHSVIRASGEK